MSKPTPPAPSPEPFKPKERPPLPIYLAQTSPLSPAVSTDPKAPNFPSIQHNLKELKRHLLLASKDLGRDGVVVFPEYALQGILQGSESYGTFAQHLLLILQSLARYYHLSIVLTLVEPSPKLPSIELDQLVNPFPSSNDVDEEPPTLTKEQMEAWRIARIRWKKENGQLVNVAVYIDGATGEVLGRYEKRNLWHTERGYLSPGTIEPPIFATPWGSASLLICWDLSHPSAVHALTTAGAEIIFCPTYWLSTDSDPAQSLWVSPLRTKENGLGDPTLTYDKTLLESLCFTRSFEGECCIVMVNPGISSRELGNTPERGFFGGSGVWVPLSGKVARSHEASWGDSVESGKSWKVDLRVLEVAKHVYKIAEDWGAGVDVRPGWTRPTAQQIDTPPPPAPAS